MPTLESRMVLHRFMCNQFGYQTLREILDRLKYLSDQLDKKQGSDFAQGILINLQTTTPTTKQDFVRYDTNIALHSQTLGMTDEKGRSWKPFQYLALLFTERYLDLYFQDSETLIEKLNQWKQTERAYTDIPEYTIADLQTLAFQSATGSGKTLLLHANILQYRHYLEQHKRLHKLNKIILVTPDEGMSRQHLRELQASNIPAQLFSDDAAVDVFSRGGTMVDIIDIHKFADKKGIKRVTPEAFEENNLVMVDEGHLGTGGKVWRKYRKQIAKNGFTFEYSATFNQAVSGGGSEIQQLRDEYGKSILFDYSYRFFYADGYGKDYKISNLQKSDDGETNNVYLLACLLSFYQQCRIYADKGAQWRDFNIAPPLWVFLGKTVTGGKLRRDAVTDVVRIINFLAWIQSDKRAVTKGIIQLTSGNTGLVDKNGADIFKDAFPYIKAAEPQTIYDDVCTAVFRGKGQLQISHLTGTDELQLSTGDASPFGVINVGDASGLYTKLEAVENAPFSLEKNAFNKPLFADVDSNNSPVNIVIGARKFAAGWNSWRVSTMGLMHVGTGEGPQIIQMFGRGVRLKGHGMSLKRHTALEGVKPDGSGDLKRLETLNIFGLKANYMEQFKKYLQTEGVNVERVIFSLPTRKQFEKVKGLKILKKHDGAGEFQDSDVRLDLPGNPGRKDAVTLDRYGYLQVLESAQQAGGGAGTKESRQFEENHLALINRQSIYHKVLERKRRSQWHNMTISQKTVNALLENSDWYALYIPADKLKPPHYGRVREWENLAVDLISEYATGYWHRKRNEWEHEHLEVVPLKNDNPNYVEKYELSVDAKEKKLIKEIEQLVKKVKQSRYQVAGTYELNLLDGAQLSLLEPEFHAYIPLLHCDTRKDIQISPVALNDGEAKFVKQLKVVVEGKRRTDFLQGKEIYLMRNLSRGKGVSFFDDFSFYPDFILWVKDANRQDILFIDPKGLAYYNSKIKSKVDLHRRIKETQKKIQQNHPELFLHSYIWTNTKPTDIGSDTKMTLRECRELGIFLDSNLEIILKHALTSAA